VIQTLKPFLCWSDTALQGPVLQQQQQQQMVGWRTVSQGNTQSLQPNQHDNAC